MNTQSPEAWCQSYVSAFSAYDVAGIASHWVYPAQVLQKGRMFTFAEQDAFARNVSGLCGFYRAQGVARAKRDLLDMFEIGAGVAAIRVKDIMLDVTGDTIVSWQAGYTLQETDKGWRAMFALADGETVAWAARGTPLGTR